MNLSTRKKNRHQQNSLIYKKIIISFILWLKYKYNLKMDIKMEYINSKIKKTTSHVSEISPIKKELGRWKK